MHRHYHIDFLGCQNIYVENTIPLTKRSTQLLLDKKKLGDLLTYDHILMIFFKFIDRYTYTVYEKYSGFHD